MKNRPYPYYDIPDVDTLRGLIRYGEENGGEHTIFYTGRQNDEPMSFIEAAKKIRALGTFLLERGYAGRNIALLGENSTEWCLAYFGVTNSGNVAVPLDKELPQKDLAELVRRCDCAALFYSERLRSTVECFRSLGDALPPITFFPLAELEADIAEGERLLAEGSTAFDRVDVQPDTLACIVYTSGTSGKSKGVMLTHGNLASDVAATCKCVTARNTQIFLPMNHTFSWASAMFAAFLYSVDAHISPNMKRVVKDLNRNRALPCSHPDIIKRMNEHQPLFLGHICSVCAGIIIYIPVKYHLCSVGLCAVHFDKRGRGGHHHSCLHAVFFCRIGNPLGVIACGSCYETFAAFFI